MSIQRTLSILAGQWSATSVKSIGGLVVAVSFVLILMAWRSIGWSMNGSWWGIGLLGFVIIMVHMRDAALVEFIISPSWTVYLPPVHLDLLLYTLGTVLFFGGTRLLRAAAFPVALLWFSNPIPRTLELHFDPILQKTAVAAAHAFARVLGTRLPADGMLLHFSPAFGFEIGPLGTGINSAMALGLVALVAAWLCRLSWRRMAAFAICASLFGIVLNLLRVLGMVAYCIVALHQTRLQPYVGQVNTALNLGLFFLGAVQLMRLLPLPNRFTFFHQPEAEIAAAMSPRFLWSRLTVFALVVSLGSASYARAALQPPTATVSNPILGVFPAHIGAYNLQRVWPETVYNKDIVVYYWASYTKNSDSQTGAKPDTVWIAVSSALGAHDSVLCRNSAGLSWLWHGDIPAATRAGLTHFSAATYRIADQQSLDAATLCSADGCGMYSTQKQRFGFVYSKPDMHALLGANPATPVSVLVRSFEPDTTLDSETARKHMVASVESFLSGADIQGLTRPYLAN